MDELLEELGEMVLRFVLVYVVVPITLLVGGVWGGLWLWDNRAQVASDECCLHYSATDDAMVWRDCRDEMRVCEPRGEP